MSAAGSFYETQAQICAQNALNTQLPMLRDKFERAGAAWTALATRETEVEAARIRRAAEAATRLSDSVSAAEARETDPLDADTLATDALLADASHEDALDAEGGTLVV